MSCYEFRLIYNFMSSRRNNIMERYAGGEEIKEGIDGELIAQVMHHTFNCARLRNYLYSEQVLMNYGQRTIRLEKEHASRPVKRVVAFERFLRNISFCSGLDVCVHDYRSNMTLLNGKALMSPDMYKHTHLAILVNGKSLRCPFVTLQI